MGWHDAREIPNYWKYAQNFVLQDKMFEPNASWVCHRIYLWFRNGLPLAQRQAIHRVARMPWTVPVSQGRKAPRFKKRMRQTGLCLDGSNLFIKEVKYFMGYYLSNGSEPDCEDDAMLCDSKPQSVNVPGIWNPLPAFDTVKQDIR